MAPMNVVVPRNAILDAHQLFYGNQFFGRGPYAINILFTNNRNVDDYKNFDRVLNLQHLTSYFYRNGFVPGIPVFRQILRITYDKVFKIVDLLKTTTDTEVYELKRQLSLYG
jgi:hypothetical protein